MAETLMLAVDTCSGQSSIALARLSAQGDFTLLGQSEVAAEWTSTALHVEIAALLSRQHLTPSEVNAYAVTNGPGSFTAVRVGAAAVKGLAEIHGRPVVPVSTLALIAQAAAWAQPSMPQTDSSVLWAPLLDARRAQVFSGIYEQESELVKVREPETVASLRSVLERCRTLDASILRFCARDMTEFAEELAAAGHPSSALVSTSAPLAGALARMGMLILNQHGGVDAAAVDANYIRASDAELFWKG